LTPSTPVSSRLDRAGLRYLDWRVVVEGRPVPEEAGLTTARGQILMAVDRPAAGCCARG